LIPAFFNNITFAQPYFFGLFLLLPVMLYWYVSKNKNSTVSIAVSSLQAKGLGSAKASFRHLPFIFRLLSLASIIIALANPRTKTNEQFAEGEGIDIAICMDVSGSMTGEDLLPNRLEAAKNVAIDFVSKRISDKIAVIIFASESFTQCPLTTDKPTVIQAIENIHSGMLTNATSIGDGLSTAIDRLRHSNTKTKIVILLTDGENNGGIIDPTYAKEIAKSFGIKVYTIGVGTDGSTTQKVQTPLGIQVQTLKVSIDEPLLKEIANETGGKYFRAKDNNGLSEIYKSIDALEKSKVEVTKLTKYYDKFLPFAALAGLFLCIEIFLRYLVFRKFP
jgi:Ca-activated chloride channel homolog